MKKTPFHQYHLDHDAKMVDFAGWDMPVMYQSVHDEHHHTRTAISLFDVSHMGRIKIAGRHARRFIERMLTRRVSDMQNMTCRYSLVCNDRGGVLDDVLIYRMADHWLLVVNASNRDKIVAHLNSHIGDMVVTIEDQTQDTAMVALQGPKVMDLLGNFSSEVPTLKRYSFCIKNLLIMKMTISRTGYTGEDGVEIILSAKTAGMALKLLAKENPDDPSLSVRPCGLGARDTLRLEAAMPLYGHELSEDRDPLSAGLDFAVNLDKDQDERGEAFIGMEALKKIASAGPRQKRVGLKLEGKRTARQHMPVEKEGAVIGEVTSGCLSPTLGYPIAMAYVDAACANIGDTVQINFGSKTANAEIVTMPFYKKG